MTLALVGFLALTGYAKFDSSVSAGEATVKTTARAVGRDDGLHAVSLVVTNASSQELLLVVGGERLVIQPGRSVRQQEATLDGYRKVLVTLKVYRRKNGAWRFVGSGKVTVLK